MTKFRSSRRFLCPYCATQFSTKCTMSQHVESIHHGKTYPCEYCDHEATQKGNLQIHIRNVHDINAKKFPCKYCKYVAKTGTLTIVIPGYIASWVLAHIHSQFNY